ncbi:MAG: radical SAM protein [Anaerolineae bacterium]|nr:radical SAM protein [Anaerolineae bacterium]
MTSSARPRLQTLIVEVTQQCNHACLHCYNVWHGKPVLSNSKVAPYPYGELDTRQTLALLAKALDETECHHVTLTGGEPLLRADLPQMIDFLRERNVRVTIISNGRLLTGPKVAGLIEQGVALFELPLLSHRRDVHDRLSGTPGAFDAVLSAMAHIRLNRGQFVAVFVATTLNIDTLYDTVRLAFAFGARGVMFNRFNPGGRGRQHIDRLLPTVEQVKEALAIANDASQEFNLPISCSIPIQPCLIDTQAFPRLGFGFCATGSERAYYTLDPLGNLRPCNHTSTILGNLFDEPFADLIATERIAEFVSATPAFCAGCDLRTACQGGCKAAAQECYGSLRAEEPFLHQVSSRPIRSL